MRRASLTVAVLAVLLGLFGITAFAHDGHPQKALLPLNWYQQVQGDDYATWMTLSTSDVILECDNDCGTRWEGAFAAAIANWNAQPTTVLLPYQDGVYNSEFDVNVIVQDMILGQPDLLGEARFFDINHNECFFFCEVWYGVAYAADDSHIGGWGTPQQRQATISHEIGHLLALDHEGMPGSTQDACGYDASGPVPWSIMSYNCIDPVLERDGEEQYEVMSWDACGVNHKFNDPNWGFAGCDGLTPHDPTQLRGDLDCDGDIDSVDSLRALRSTAGLDPGVPGGCAPLNTFALARSGIAGDINCDNDVESLDGLLLLRHVASLALGLREWCPGPAG